MRRFILIFVLLLTSTLYADGITTPYDKGAARSDLSNVDSATGLAALNTQSWTSAEKTQALVGSSTVAHSALNYTGKDYLVTASNATATAVVASFINASYTEILDGDGVFSNSIYTAPKTGLYIVSGHCRTAATAWSVSDAVLVRLAINGSTQTNTIGVGFAQVAATYQMNCKFFDIVRLTAGQAMSVRIYSARNTTMDATINYNFLSISYLVSD